MKILRFSEYPGNKEGNGGDNRSQQLLFYFNTIFGENHIINSIKYFRFTYFPWSKKIVYFLDYNLNIAIKYKLKPTFDHNKGAFLSKAINHYLRIINDHSPDIILYESGCGIDGCDWIIPIIAQRKKIKIFAFPHNLDSLVYKTKPHLLYKKKIWLEAEINSLKLCDKVFTISMEELWLLRIHKVDSHYIPYIPAPNRLKQLERIKSDREKEEKEQYGLFIGTVINTPSMKGLEELLSFYSKLENQKLKVAGYGTEKILNKTTNNIEILGAVEKEVLNKLLVKCNYIIIKGFPTSGVLTRIIECIICGIPVLCDFNASRSLYNLPNIHLFEDFEDLQHLLKKEISIKERIDLGNHNSVLKKLNRNIQ